MCRKWAVSMKGSAPELVLIWVDLGDTMAKKAWSYPPFGTKFMFGGTGPSPTAVSCGLTMGFSRSEGSGGSKTLGSTFIPFMLVVLLIGGRGRFPSNMVSSVMEKEEVHTEHREEARERKREREGPGRGSKNGRWA